MTVTARQQQILDAIQAHTAAHGVPPTFREIGAAVGIRSSNGVAEQIEKLWAKGLIDRPAHGKQRAIRLAAKPGCCPTCGRATEVAGG